MEHIHKPASDTIRQVTAATIPAATTNAADTLTVPSDTLRAVSRRPGPSSPFGWFTGEAGLLSAEPLPPYREAAAEEVMGPGSVLIPEDPVPAEHPSPFISDGMFQGLVLVLAALYAMLLYYNLGDIRALFSHIVRNSTGGKHGFDECRGSSFPQFLNTSGLIGLFFIGILAVKYGDVLLPEVLVRHIPAQAAMPLSVGVTLALCAVLSLQWLMLRLVGIVTLSDKFIARLRQLRQLYFTLATIVISPALLLFVLCRPDEGEIWFFLIVIELAIMLLLYLREALSLFIGKKISILHWILYLCTVEIFPMSLLWLVATR